MGTERRIARIRTSTQLVKSQRCSRNTSIPTKKPGVVATPGFANQPAKIPNVTGGDGSTNLDCSPAANHRDRANPRSCCVVCVAYPSNYQTDRSVTNRTRLALNKTTRPTKGSRPTNKKMIGSAGLFDRPKLGPVALCRVGSAQITKYAAEPRDMRSGAACLRPTGRFLRR